MKRAIAARTARNKSANARSAPFLPYTSCDLRAVLDRVRCERVPKPSGQIPVLFIAQDSLACLRHHEAAEILLHRLLNTPETPVAVFLHIFTHEMLHLVIPSRLIEGKDTRHPPEFLEQEMALAPERGESWAWIWMNFGAYLREDKRRERTIVRPGWQQMMFTPRVPMEECIVTEKRLLL